MDATRQAPLDHHLGRGAVGMGLAFVAAAAVAIAGCGSSTTVGSPVASSGLTTPAAPAATSGPAPSVLSPTIPSAVAPTPAGTPGRATAEAPTPPASPGATPATAGGTPIVAPNMAPEAALKTLWESAGPKGGRAWNWLPAIDPSGRIWTAASFDNVFWIFDRNGKYLESWGTPGDGEGQFQFVVDNNGYGAVAFAPDGGFYVADSSHSRVLQFDKSRKLVRTVGTFGTDNGQFAAPMMIYTDSKSNFYVVDANRGDVQQFSADGTYLRTVSSGMGPYMALDASGNVYAVDENSSVLYRFSVEGTKTPVADLSSVVNFATGIEVAPSGHIYITSAHGGGSSPVYEHLVELDPSGKLLHVWPNGGEAFVIDPRGDRLYMTYSDQLAGVRAFALPKP
jgi:hypothetical protein